MSIDPMRSELGARAPRPLVGILLPNAATRALLFVCAFTARAAAAPSPADWESRCFESLEQTRAEAAKLDPAFGGAFQIREDDINLNTPAVLVSFDRWGDTSKTDQAWRFSDLDHRGSLLWKNIPEPLPQKTQWSFDTQRNHAGRSAWMMVRHVSLDSAQRALTLFRPVLDKCFAAAPTATAWQRSCVAKLQAASKHAVPLEDAARRKSYEADAAEAEKRGERLEFVIPVVGGGLSIAVDSGNYDVPREKIKLQLLPRQWPNRLGIAIDRLRSSAPHERTEWQRQNAATAPDLRLSRSATNGEATIETIGLPLDVANKLVKAYQPAVDACLAMPQ